MTTTSRPRAASAPGGWLLRIVRHRARAQWRLLGVTATVALVVATLVATLALVLHLTETSGVGRALTLDPERSRVTVTASRLTGTVSDVSADAAEDIGELLGVPVTHEVQATTDLYAIDRTGAADALTYVDRRDRIQTATLVEGTWPEPWTGSGPVPVAVPAVGAEALGIELGDTIEVHERNDDDAAVRLAVVGVYDVPYPTRDEWGRDRLGGQGYSPTFPVPGTAGFLTTDAFGPLVVPAGTLDAGAFAVMRTTVVVSPDLAGVAAGRLAGLRAVADDLGDEVGYRLDTSVGTLDVAAGSLRALLREVAMGVVVTRAGVAVAAVLLLLVAFAALLQTARLVADARSAEHDLMRARGASRAHLVAALVVETGLVGLVVAVAGPALAPLLLRTLGGPVAEGLEADLGAAVRDLPPTAWGAGVVVALMLLAATLVPLVGAPSTFVEGQQARGRAARSASLARLAVDGVVVALAVGAWTQLRQYGGLLVGRGDGMSVDPVLVVGPALLVLAAVLVGVRVLTLVTRLAERGAGRGRGVVLPLTGWELGRRPRPAATAVMLLALALGATTFGLTQSATWDRSQRDQAAFAVGAPAVVVDERTTATDGGVLRGTGVAPQPVGRLTVDVGARTPELALYEAAFGGVTTHALAATVDARALLNEGRLATEGGAEVAALGTVPATRGGIDLGEDVVGISANVEITGPRLVPGVAVALRAVIEDDLGVLSTVTLGSFRIDEGGGPVARLLPEVQLPVTPDPQDAADRLAAVAERRAYPLRLVGLQAVVMDDGVGWSNVVQPYDADVVLTDLAVLRPAADVTAVDPADLVDDFRIDGARHGLVVDPVDVPRGRWNVTGTGLSTTVRNAPSPTPLWLRLSGNAGDLGARATLGAVVAWEPVRELTVVISRPLAERLGPETEEIAMRVFGVIVRGTVAGVVDHVPTVPDRISLAVDATSLARVVAENALDQALVDEWWVDTPDPEAWAASLPTDVAGRPLEARTTTLPGTTAEYLQHPLRAAVPLVLGLLAVGGALVATVAFAVHTVVSVRERGLQLAQLRAVGLTRGRLTTVLGLETAVLAVLGVGLGLGVGTGVAAQVTRLLVVGADGGEPVPRVLLAPAQGLEWVGVVAAAVVAVLAVGIALAQRAANPASLLRAGEAR